MRRPAAATAVLFTLVASGCAAGGRGAAPAEWRAPLSPPAGASATGSAGPVGRPSAYCGEVPDASGRKGDIRLYADGGDKGTVPCPEALDVMTEFFARAPEEAGGDRGSLAVRDWNCEYGSGPSGDWISTCHKAAWRMHAELPKSSAAPSGTGAQSGGPEESPQPDASSPPPGGPSAEDVGGSPSAASGTPSPPAGA
ncbi:hypothetical protein ACFV3R_22500 [Streptomyces sp. NPDC059740]|uniref:hypothetical protein n=1 Tax=Streptomyces sp. NPDC059740 TaxID=3346926 RepID=UPI0036627406